MLYNLKHSQCCMSIHLNKAGEEIKINISHQQKRQLGTLQSSEDSSLNALGTRFDLWSGELDATGQFKNFKVQLNNFLNSHTKLFMKAAHILKKWSESDNCSNPAVWINSTSPKLLQKSVYTGASLRGSDPVQPTARPAFWVHTCKKTAFSNTTQM